MKTDTSTSSDTKALHTLLDNEWNKGVEQYPEWATQLGDNRFNDQLNDASYETIIRLQGESKDLHEKIKDIDRSNLSVEDQLNYDLFLNDLNHNMKGFEYLLYLQW